MASPSTPFTLMRMVLGTRSSRLPMMRHPVDRTEGILQPVAQAAHLGLLVGEALHGQLHGQAHADEERHVHRAAAPARPSAPRRAGAA